MKIRIISRSGEAFRNRQEAGRLLADQLESLRGRDAVVLGIPRGGLIVARELALFLEADLDVVLSRKLGTPGHRELAMGSLSEDGKVFLNEGVVQAAEVSQREIDQERILQLNEIAQRARLVRRILPKTLLANRIVIITDDGLATGATMEAALWAVKLERPQRLIVAVPVASEEAVQRAALAADEVICLRLPESFNAVGQFYYQFPQIEDEEMILILKEEARRRQVRVSPGR
jgi:putative phosphoribosyl transferase